MWRLRNPKKRKYTLRQKHLSGIIQRRLDHIFIFISQKLQEYFKKSDVLNALSTDDSPVFAQYQNEMNSTKAKAKGCGSLITL